MSLISKATYAVTRKTGSYIDGIYVPGTDSNFSVKGNCQPVSGEDVLQISEGDRTKQLLKIYTKTELKINDIVTVDSKLFEAHPVQNWTRQVRLAHYKTILILKDI